MHDQSKQECQLLHRTDDQTGQCPTCGSSESTVSIVVINETTVRGCTHQTCSGTWWTADSMATEGLTEAPEFESILNRFVDAAQYHENEHLLDLVGEIATLYRDAGMDVPDRVWGKRPVHENIECAAELVADD